MMNTAAAAPLHNMANHPVDYDEEENDDDDDDDDQDQDLHNIRHHPVDNDDEEDYQEIGSPQYYISLGGL